MRVATILLVAFIGLTLVSCIPEKTAGVRFVNETNEDLFVEVNDSGVSPVRAGDTKSIAYLSTRVGSGDDPFRVDVYDDRGCRAMIFETTVDDFNETFDKTLTIGEVSLIPADERLDCVDL